MEREILQVPLHFFDDSKSNSKVKNVVKYTQTQILDICEVKHVLALANGPFVDLYRLHQLEKISSTKCHLPLLGQILLKEFLPDHYEQDVKATSILFLQQSSVLLVGAFVEDDQSSWLFGFRYYLSNLTGSRYKDSSHCNDIIEDEVLTHLIFADKITSPPTATNTSSGVRSSGNGIAYMEKTRSSTLQNGAVFFLIANSRKFGIMTWTDRLTDRMVSIAQVTTSTACLATGAIKSGEDGDDELIVLSDIAGGAHLLDMSRFQWNKETSVGRHYTSAGKKLQSITTIHTSTGRVLQHDHPLDVVRIIYSSSGTAKNVLEATEIPHFISSFRWMRIKEKTFLWAAITDGSMRLFRLSESALETFQIYPTLISSGSLHQWHVFQHLPTDADSKDFISFASILDQNTCQWTKWTVNPDKLPTLNEYMEFPVLNYSWQDEEGKGEDHGTEHFKCGSLLNSSNLQALFAIQAKAIGVLITDQNVRFIAFEAKEKETIDPHSIISLEEYLRQREAKQQLAMEEEELEEVAEEEEKLEVVRSTKQRPPLTIQAKYQLPPMPMKDYDEDDTKDKENQNQEQNFNSQGKSISRKEFQERLDHMSSRVKNLHGNLDTLRHSFHLFMQDIQLHMNNISMELETYYSVNKDVHKEKQEASSI